MEESVESSSNQVGLTQTESNRVEWSRAERVVKDKTPFNLCHNIRSFAEKAHHKHKRRLRVHRGNVATEIDPKCLSEFEVGFAAPANIASLQKSIGSICFGGDERIRQIAVSTSNPNPTEPTHLLAVPRPQP